MIVSKLHIYIDGSWLFKICGKGKVLPSVTLEPQKSVHIDFNKLNKFILNYISKDQQLSNIEIGDCYLITSLIDNPENYDDLIKDGISQDAIDTYLSKYLARKYFVDNATVRSNYRKDGVIQPKLKKWMLKKLDSDEFQEKKVDTTLVALLVRDVLEKNSSDYFAVIFGDSDILPAIKIACPDYSRNVFVITTDPEHLKKEHRESSYSINDKEFDFKIPPIYIENYLEYILHGDYCRCKECNKIYLKDSSGSKFYCPIHVAQRT